MTKIAVCLLAYNEEDVIQDVIEKGYNYLESLGHSFLNCGFLTMTLKIVLEK